MSENAINPVHMKKPSLTTRYITGDVNAASMAVYMLKRVLSLYYLIKQIFLQNPVVSMATAS